jgi:hypothetical protein
MINRRVARSFIIYVDESGDDGFNFRVEPERLDTFSAVEVQCSRSVGER